MREELENADEHLAELWREAPNPIVLDFGRPATADDLKALAAAILRHDLSCDEEEGDVTLGDAEITYATRWMTRENAYLQAELTRILNDAETR